MISSPPISAQLHFITRPKEFLPEKNLPFPWTVASQRLMSVAFSPNRELLAAGTANGEIWLRQSDGRTLLLTCLGHTDGVWSITFSPDRKILASDSDDQTVRLWEVSTGYCIKTLQGYTSRIWSVAFSPDGMLLASGSHDQTVRL